MIKSDIKALLAPETVGALRYLRSPRLGRRWGGPFNGQRGRCILFAQLVHVLGPKAIVETGTYLGTTTEWMAAFQLPVFTIEAHAENFGFAQARLAPILNVSIMLGDSRSGLRKLLAGPLQAHKTECVLVYLDAHWNDDLPLAGELEIIFDGLPNAVAMIDDFEVPGVPGYTYDDYGPGKALKLEYLNSAINRYDLAVYFPTLPADEETGAKRGCVILARTGLQKSAISSLKLLLRRVVEPPSVAADKNA